MPRAIDFVLERMYNTKISTFLEKGGGPKFSSFSRLK